MEISVKTKITMACQPQSRQTESLFCSDCQKLTEILTVAEAAMMIGCDTRAIFGWIELGWLHFMKTSKGLRVCKNSLGRIIPIKN